MAKKLIDNNINLLNINKSCVVKAKKHFVEAKNKKFIITRAKKTKTKFIRIFFFDFKYIDAIIKLLCNNKKNNNNKIKSKKQKKLKIDNIIAINIYIQIFNKNIDKIYKNIKNIIIKQTIKKTTKKNIITIFTIFTIFATFAISIIIKKIIKKIM